MGEDAQLDLAVVGAKQLPTLLGQEGLADLTAVGRADGDVLEVGIAAGEPSCGGHRLVEVGMYPAGFWFHQQGQGIHIGAL